MMLRLLGDEIAFLYIKANHYIKIPSPMLSCVTMENIKHHSVSQSLANYFSMLSLDENKLISTG